jgi:putative ABC transport system permease protein
MDAFSQTRDTQTLYFPSAVRTPRLDLVVKTAADPKAVLGDLRRTLRAAWPDVSLDQVRPLSDALELRYAGEPRSVVVLMGLLAALALVLTLAGIYGVLSRQVQERRKEMGIRLALGGGGSRVAALVVRQAMTVVATGLLLGVGGGFALGLTLRSQLYEVKPEDVRIHLVALLLLAAAALLACVVPAVRAASVDPAKVLREE